MRSSLLTVHALPAYAIAALTGLAIPSANADTTINFDSLTAGAQAQGGAESLGGTYSSQGFTLTSSTNIFQAFAGNSHDMGDGETSLFSYADGSTTLTEDDGGTFTFNAIDLGSIPSYAQFGGAPSPVTFVGMKSDGNVVIAIHAAPAQSSFQTFTFSGFTDLTSLTFGPAPGAQNPPQFDNIQLNQAPVPEVSSEVSLGLLLALGGLMISVRCRKVRPQSRASLS